MAFNTIFDAGQQGYTTGWACYYCLPLVVIGALAVFRPALMVRLRGFVGDQVKVQIEATKLFNWAFFIFALLLSAIIFLATFLQYQTAISDLGAGRCSVAEGPVTDFVSTPYSGYGGHSSERFTVNGKRFSYSDIDVTSGFHNTATHGGPIREGLYVRINYSGNLILRLEVAQ